MSCRQTSTDYPFSPLSPVKHRSAISNFKSFCYKRQMVDWLLVLSIDPSILMLDPEQLPNRYSMFQA